MHRRPMLLVVVLVAASLAGCSSPSASEGAASADPYRVSIEARAEGQPLSPGVIVTHEPDVHLFELGRAPSDGLVSIAEDGNATPAAAELAGAEGVYAVVHTDAPIDRPRGQADLPTERTFEVDATGEADRLSVAVMLICSNDGFAGIDGLALPGEGTVSLNLSAYDAGSEENTEAWPDVVDTCQEIGPLSAEPDGNADGVPGDGGVVSTHPGIAGGADLRPDLHGWNGSVARLTVTALD